MTTPAIKVEGLSKQYTVGAAQQHATFYDLLTHAIKMPFKGRRNDGEAAVPANQFWALRDINFEVQPGDVLGIIGRNGAGKSTLLKILSRITDPTEGKVRISGRVASLLEVGTGFHPELTGRENIFLNGAVLGMSRAEIKERFSDIVAFAEVEKFLDTPVKRYSSGMYVRLAFSVAAHLQPDILIVDEVLAVGDYEFQRKCLGKLEEVGTNGRTVIMVSHNLTAIANLCTRVIWLDQGRLIDVGPAREIIRAYLNQRTDDRLVWEPPISANSSFRYHRVQVLSESGTDNGDGFSPNDPLVIVFDYTVLAPLAPGRIALTISDQEGNVVLASASSDRATTLVLPWVIGRSISRCFVSAPLLAPGYYHISISEPADSGDVVHDSILSFRISDLGSLRSRDGRGGVVVPKFMWSNDLANSSFRQ